MLKDNRLVENSYLRIKETIKEARSRVYKTINKEMLECYFNVGSIIVELVEAVGDEKSQNEIIRILSDKLTNEFGKGFNRSNLIKMKQFYQTYKGSSTMWNQLSWSHYRLLIKINNDKKRSFYQEECLNAGWNVRQKDPYILEFLNIKENAKFYEKDLESNLIEHLQAFLLELGKGFSFVARQKRLDIEGDNFYIDLVFYNYILKCFVIIELKTEKLTYQDIGQLDFYVRYFDDKIKLKEDNPTIGIILSSSKNDTVVKYSVLNDNNNLFASSYKLYIPTEEELIKEINLEKENLNNQLEE